jgi:photosystem I subunit PsaN
MRSGDSVDADFLCSIFFIHQRKLIYLLTPLPFSQCRTKVQARVAKLQPRARCTKMVAAAQLRDNRVQVAGIAAAALALAIVPSAKADLVSDLLAKSTANAELHNKQRLATSYSNFARSRTVTDGTCKFPANVLGCDLGTYAGDVAFIADDAKIECEGKADGKCASNISIPQKNQ